MIGNLGVFAFLFLIGSLCLWCFIIAGFFGIACGAVGLISAPIIFLAISISSTVISEGYELASVAKVYGSIRD